MQLNILSLRKTVVLAAVMLAFLGTPFLANPVSFAAEERTIPYPPGYVIDKEGASSFKGIGNVEASPYFSTQDY